MRLCDSETNLGVKGFLIIKALVDPFHAHRPGHLDLSEAIPPEENHEGNHNKLPMFLGYENKVIGSMEDKRQKEREADPFLP